jgi:glycosyltransferase involved in cell wall biosynthesis
MKKGDADVSVIVPLYNHERYVVAALESIFQQSVRPREVIVIDDGSSDNSFELLQKKFENEKKLIFWSRPNEGAHHTLNTGIYRATSSTIAILNSDDKYEPERLQRCLELFELDQAADIICTGITFIDGDGKKTLNKWYEQAHEFYIRNGDLALSLINGNFLMTTSNFVVRRSAFEKYGYFGKFRYAHDLAFLLRVLARGGKIHIDPRPLLQYRIHDSNTISESVLKVKVELAVVVAEHIFQIYHSKSHKFNADYLKMLYDVLDTHNLSRMLFPVIATITTLTSSAGGVDDLLADIDIANFLLTIAK